MSATKTKANTVLLPLSTFLAAKPCQVEERIADFTARHGRPPDETSTVAEWAAVTNRVSDLLWGLRFVPAEKARKVACYVATRCARRVLPIFRAKYPDDARPRRAIELAEKWLENPASVTEEELKGAIDAIYATDADDTPYANFAAINAIYTDATARAAAFATTTTTYTPGYVAAATYATGYAAQTVARARAPATSYATSYAVAYDATAAAAYAAAYAAVIVERATQRQDFLDALELYL